MEYTLTVSDDALLRSVRQELRKKHGYPPGVGLRKAGRKARSKPWGVPCVYSLESAGSAVQGGGGTLCDRLQRPWLGQSGLAAVTL